MRFDWNEEISSAAVKILQLVSIQEIEQGWKEGGSEAGRRKGGRVGPSNGAEGDEKVCTYREGANSSGQHFVVQFVRLYVITDGDLGWPREIAARLLVWT